MSIEVTLEDDGQVRVKVDRGGERAVSDVVNAEDLIRRVANVADVDLSEMSNEEEPEELTGQPGIDESAPPEEDLSA